MTSDKGHLEPLTSTPNEPQAAMIVAALKDRGTLAGTAPDYTGVTSATFAQEWGLSILGKWNSFKQDDNGDGSGGGWDLEQARVHNDVNEIDTDNIHDNAKGTSITASPGTNWFDPLYDAAGNMTEFPKPDDPANGYTAVYDAWNRMVEVKDETSGDTVAKYEYEYDGVGRRIVKQEYDTPGTYSRDRHYYYTIGWRLIEERIDSSTSADQQYVWGLRYVDDLILRDRDDAAGGDLGVTGSGLDERLYALQDAHFNVTSITNSSGGVVERFQYTPYGRRTILDSDFSEDADLFSDYGWVIGHQGLAHDDESGLIYNFARYQNPVSGRFMQRDPIGYLGGSMSLYQYVHSQPTFYLDPSGLVAVCDKIYECDKDKCKDLCFTKPARGAKSDRMKCEEKAQKKRDECNERLRPLAVKEGVKIALDRLGVGGVSPTVGSGLKAGITQADKNNLISQVTMTTVDTMSGDNAYRAPLSSEGELKLYEGSNGDWSLAVGYPTDSWSHWLDGAQYKLGMYPGNAENAEDLMGFSVFDGQALEDLGKSCSGDKDEGGDQ